MPGWIRTIIVTAFVCLLVGCAVDAPRVDAVGLRMINIQHWHGGGDYATLRYPHIVGTLAGQLNSVIERWIGGHCPIVGTKPRRYDDAAACATAFADECARLRASSPPGHPFGCTLDANAVVDVDAAGVLGLTMTSYAYAGGAHGLTTITDLTLDLRSGRALDLDDLLDYPDRRKLSALIEQGLRHQRHIPPDQSLKQAGYFTNKLPVPATVLALPEGLRFTYQSYDIGPRTMGQPQALVPYAALSEMVRRDGPLFRLHRLLASDAP